MNVGFVALRNEVTAGSTALRNEMIAGTAALRGEMTADSTALRSDMTAGSTTLRSELTAGFAFLRSEMTAIDQRGERDVVVGAAVSLFAFGTYGGGKELKKFRQDKADRPGAGRPLPVRRAGTLGDGAVSA